MTRFTTLDWSIVVVYLIGSAIAGIWCRRFIRDMSDFTVAGRNLRSSLGVATMIGTELGLVTVMFMAQKGFTSGLAALHIALLAGLVTLIVGWTGFIVVPLRRQGVMTIPEFYDRRFGTDVRVFGGLVLALSGILNMGLFLRAGADFIVGVTGMQSGDDLAVGLKLIMTALLALVLFYTMLGGMLSIILTDYIQFIVLSIGLLVTCAIAFGETGWERIVDAVTSVETITKPAGEAALNPFFRNELGKGLGSTYVFWQAFLAMVSCAIWQTAVMRACAATDETVVRRIYMWSSIGFLVRCLVPIFLGVCALAYFANDADLTERFLPGPVDDSTPEGMKAAGAYSSTSLSAMPVFLGRILPPGLLGLVTAGMLAAFMSTHDSYLLCWSSVLTQDVVAPCVKSGLSQRRRLLLTRSLIFAIGIFLLVWGLWYPLGQDMWEYMAITGGIYFTGAFSLLTGGLYWKRASRVGAHLAIASGIFAAAGLKPVKLALGHELSAETVGLGSVALSVVVFVVGSLLFPDQRGGDA